MFQNAFGCKDGYYTVVKDPELRFGLVSSRTKASGRGLLKRGRRSQPGFIPQPQLQGLQGQAPPTATLANLAPLRWGSRRSLRASAATRLQTQVRGVQCGQPLSQPPVLIHAVRSIPSCLHPSLSPVLPLTWWLALVSRETVPPSDGNTLPPSWSCTCETKAALASARMCRGVVGDHWCVPTQDNVFTCSEAQARSWHRAGMGMLQPLWGDSDVSKASPEAQTLAQGWWRNVTIPFQMTVFHGWANAANAKCRTPTSSSSPSCTSTTLWCVAWAVQFITVLEPLHGLTESCT